MSHEELFLNSVTNALIRDRPVAQDEGWFVLPREILWLSMIPGCNNHLTHVRIADTCTNHMQTRKHLQIHAIPQTLSPHYSGNSITSAKWCQLLLDVEWVPSTWNKYFRLRGHPIWVLSGITLEISTWKTRRLEKSDQLDQGRRSHGGSGAGAPTALIVRGHVGATGCPFS